MRPEVFPATFAVAAKTRQEQRRSGLGERDNKRGDANAVPIERAVITAPGRLRRDGLRKYGVA